MPKLKFMPQAGRIPKEDRLKRLVHNLLNIDKCDAVIVLTDVYTGTDDFKNADDAKAKMNQWVENIAGFYPHVALHDFEAWLIPYWSEIQKLAGCKKSKPGNNPEQINHDKPPSKHIKEIFESGKRISYSKPRDAKRILENQDLLISARACSELKKFLNRILELCGRQLIE